jgi:amidophosphoribosyltransferase
VVIAMLSFTLCSNTRAPLSPLQVGLVAFRDPHGIRPLTIGKRPSADSSGIEWAIASEDCAFGPIAFERVRDVQPGEMVIITPEGQLLSKQVRGCCLL